MKNIFAVAFTFFSALAIQISHAASFNCSTAGLTRNEQTICGDASLSALDSKLGALYSLAKNNASDSDKAAILTTQKAWVARRNQCTNTVCLVDAYNARIAQLSSAPAGPDSPSGPVGISSRPTIPSSTSSQISPTVQPIPVAEPSSSTTLDDLSSLKAEKQSSVSSVRKLISKQIGFKDFRLGKSVATTQEIPGFKDCSYGIQIPEPSAGWNAQVIQTIHARWDPLIKDVVACNASTTVLEKPASVAMVLFGDDPQTVISITLTVDSADLQTISDLLSKTLGAPKNTTVTETVDQARAEIQQAEMKECEQIGESFRNSSALASQEVARCHQQVPGRVLMRMTQVPVDGIVQHTRSWSVDGAEVGYSTINVGEHPTTTIQFNAIQGGATVSKLIDGLNKDLKDREAVARNAESAAKSKDF
jgi:uncharacterized protein